MSTPQYLRTATTNKRLQIPAVALGVLALAAGCGSSGSSSSAAPASQSPQGSASGGSGGSGGGGGTGARPGTTGTISQVNQGSIFVQNPQNGQVTVNYTTKTTFSQTATTTASALKAGDCVTATSAAPAGGGSTAPSSGAPVTSLTATAVTITSTSGNCTRFGGAGGPTGRPSGAPRANRSFAPGGAGRRGGGFGNAAFGTVASVGNGSFVVNSTRGSSTTKVTVTTTPATTYRQIESATQSNLKVGLCATAIGSTDDTGAVSARSIALSTPGANGCTMGFGAGRFGGGRGGQ